MQEVYLGRTQSGIPGLFTKGFLACLLSDVEFNNIELVREKCKRMQFKLIKA